MTNRKGQSNFIMRKSFLEFCDGKNFNSGFKRELAQDTTPV